MATNVDPTPFILYLPALPPSMPCRLSEVNASLKGKSILIRGRLHGSRETGKVLFLTIRQTYCSLQCIVLKGDNPELFKWAASIPKESVVDLTGEVNTVEKRVVSVTQGDVEVNVKKLFIISAASPILPFTLEDASRSDAAYAARDAEIKEAEAAIEKAKEAAKAAGGSEAEIAAAAAAIVVPPAFPSVTSVSSCVDERGLFGLRDGRVCESYGEASGWACGRVLRHLCKVEL
jgi:hypothetical protein